jgi:hypothetical protein
VTADYPDWTRLFYLTGTAITIPINIETSTVTLDVNLVGSDIDLNVNITAATVTLDINFTDQAVAVFDAAKWFAHNAQQVSVMGGSQVLDNSGAYVGTRTVPNGKTFFIGGVGWGINATSLPKACHAVLEIQGTEVVRGGSSVGGGIIFDVPFRATAGQIVKLLVLQYGSGAQLYAVGGFWGYDEVA